MTRLTSCVTVLIVAGLGIVPAFGQQDTGIEINHPTPQAFDHFGGSQAMNQGVKGTAGGNIVVGVRDDDPGGLTSGSAFLFDPAGTLLHTFANPSASTPGDAFGNSVAGLGTGHVVIGAPYDEDLVNKDNAGAAYVFDTNTGALAFSLKTTKGNGSNLRKNDHFGVSVGASDSHVFIGATGDNNGGMSDAGGVFQFTATGSKVRNYINPEPDVNDHFGWAIAAKGNNLLVGVPDDDGDPNASGLAGEGNAFLFDAASGSLLQTFRNPAPIAGGKFGWAVDILVGATGGGNVTAGSDLAIIGAPNNGGDAGAAYVFDIATGALLETISHGNRTGYSIAAIDGSNLVAVGAPRYDWGASSGADGGALFVSSVVSGEHEIHLGPIGDSAHPAGQHFAYFGNSAAVVGSGATAKVIAGARWDNISITVSEAGSVSVFDIPEPTTALLMLGLGGLTLARRRSRA